MKDNFIEIYKANISRDGSDKLLEWLEKTDFFRAPASTKFHGAHEGGLVEHSISVFNRFACENPESRAICALLHDICKVNFYKTEMRNVKVNGTWEQQPYYVVEDQLPYGHGEKSVYIISGFIRLSRDEAMAINWHMGGFDDRVKGGSYALSEAFAKYPMALNLHIADMQATYFDEVKQK